MCGIIATLGRSDAMDSLIGGLENLEYRGYDSAGIAIKNGGELEVRKRAGEVDNLKSEIPDAQRGNMGIGHTRWSTHGPPTDRNAHPHTDASEDVAVVHNGIITNYESLKSELRNRGRTFDSDTDTEVIPHLIDEYRAVEVDSETAFRQAIGDLEGNFAVAAIMNGEETVYAARRGSPLVLGVGEDACYLASDTPAFLEYTDQVVYLQDGDVALLDENGYRIVDLDGNPVERSVDTVEWDAADAAKGAYEHYMLKEIHTQPTALTNTIEGRIEDGEIELEDFPSGTFSDIDHVQLVACGTSYHAAMYAESMLRDAGVNARAILASEYEYSCKTVGDQTLVIAVTQSGETADTLEALRLAKSHGARTIAVTNVVGSSADRQVDSSLYIRAGPEIGVAATKTYSSQAVALVLLSQCIAGDIPNVSPVDDREQMLTDLADLPDHIETILAQTDAKAIAEKYLDSSGYFFIGRGLGYSVALEGALKFKEITYEHAEGFPSGELKHGPLALVTDETPVFAIYTGDGNEKTKTNATEAQTRGAPIVAVGSSETIGTSSPDEFLEIPDTHSVWAGLLANVQLQLLSYHAANELGRPIDKPRNLAKSVTVE